MNQRKNIELDVSEYEAPHPLEMILKATLTLTTNECLIVRHRLNPVGLYPHLVRLNLIYSTIKNSESDYIIKIWRE